MRQSPRGNPPAVKTQQPEIDTGERRLPLWLSHQTHWVVLHASTPIFFFFFFYIHLLLIIMELNAFCPVLLNMAKDTLEKLPRNHHLVTHKKGKRRSDQFHIGTDFSLRELHPLTTSLCQKEAHMMRGSCFNVTSFGTYSFPCCSEGKWFLHETTQFNKLLLKINTAADSFQINIILFCLSVLFIYYPNIKPHTCLSMNSYVIRNLSNQTRHTGMS